MRSAASTIAGRARRCCLPQRVQAAHADASNRRRKIVISCNSKLGRSKRSACDSEVYRTHELSDFDSRTRSVSAWKFAVACMGDRRVEHLLTDTAPPLVGVDVNRGDLGRHRLCVGIARWDDIAKSSDRPARSSNTNRARSGFPTGGATLRFARRRSGCRQLIGHVPAIDNLPWAHVPALSAAASS